MISIKKNFRPNVAAIILSPDYPLNCNIFVGKRIDMDGVWQFPQGGIDEGERPIEALYRELYEEIGTNKVDIIAQYPQWLSYEFPDKIASKMYPFDGQIQKYFLVRLKSKSFIKLNTKHPEFDDFRFVKIKEAFKIVSSFKKPVYQTVLNYFKKEGYL